MGIPAIEGYWRPFEHKEDVPADWPYLTAEEWSLPWPRPDTGWSGRGAFLTQLEVAEMKATRKIYRGFSFCRLCGKRNGHEEFGLGPWRWPEGFRHYVADHDVRPSADFAAFVASGHIDDGSGTAAA